MAGLEAMSYAKPVIAFGMGGIPEWLEDGRNGFLIKPYNIQQMAEKIAYFLKKPQTAGEMGNYGRGTAARFNREDYQEKLLSFYREAVNEWNPYGK